MKTLEERWKESEVCKRVDAVESFAQIHGFSEWHGQTIPEYIKSELQSQAKAFGDWHNKQIKMLLSKRPEEIINVSKDKKGDKE